MDGLKKKVYTDIGGLAEEQMAKRLKAKYSGSRKISQGDAAALAPEPPPEDAMPGDSASVIPPHKEGRGKIVGYEKVGDQLLVKYENGGFGVTDNSDQNVQAVDQAMKRDQMSTYGRDVADRKGAGEAPAMRDPHAVPGTPEYGADTQKFIAEAKAAHPESQIPGIDVPKPAPEGFASAPTPMPEGNEEEEELLARAGK